MGNHAAIKSGHYLAAFLLKHRGYEGMNQAAERTLEQRQGARQSVPCIRSSFRQHFPGVISARIARLDREKLNLGIDVFVAVKTNQHNWEWLVKFIEFVSKIPVVVEFYRLAGESDYLLRVVVPDIPASSLRCIFIGSCYRPQICLRSSSFAMERIEYTTSLALEYAASGKAR